MLAVAILKPVVVLAGWTMVMWFWLYITRMPALAAANVDMDAVANDPAMTLDRILPAKVQRVAKNYNHLHEAPTVFYAVALVLAVMGAGGNHGAWVAWGYVAFRIAHSLVQATVDRIPLRFLLFTGSSACLMVLVARAVQVVFGL